LKAAALALSVAGTVLFVTSWVWINGAEQRALLRLPDEERRALYARTLETVESSCNPHLRAEGLDELCYEQAALLTKFPECDGACMALVARRRSPPSR
jgi:hypothetical protein